MPHKLSSACSCRTEKAQCKYSPDTIYFVWPTSQPCSEDTPASSWHHDSSHCHTGSLTVMTILGCVHSEAGFLKGTSSRCNPLLSKVSCTRSGGTRPIFCLPSSPLGFLVNNTQRTTNSISCCSWDNSCSQLCSLNSSHICCMSPCHNPFTLNIDIYSTVYLQVFCCFVYLSLR